MRDLEFSVGRRTVCRLGSIDLAFYVVGDQLDFWQSKRSWIRRKKRIIVLLPYSVSIEEKYEIVKDRLEKSIPIIQSVTVSSRKAPSGRIAGTNQELGRGSMAN